MWNRIQEVWVSDNQESSAVNHVKWSTLRGNSRELLKLAISKWRTGINMMSSPCLPQTVKPLNHLEVKLRLDGMPASELEP